MSVAVTYTSREEIQVHKFSWAVSIGIPLLAIFVQVFFPLRLRFLLRPISMSAMCSEPSMPATATRFP